MQQEAKILEKGATILDLDDVSEKMALQAMAKDGSLSAEMG